MLYFKGCFIKNMILYTDIEEYKNQLYSYFDYGSREYYGLYC